MAITIPLIQSNQPESYYLQWKALCLFMYLGIDAKYKYIPEHSSHAIIEIYCKSIISGTRVTHHSTFHQVAYKRRWKLRIWKFYIIPLFKNRTFDKATKPRGMSYCYIPRCFEWVVTWCEATTTTRTRKLQSPTSGFNVKWGSLNLGSACNGHRQ